jgi:hypothetical protein
MASGNTTKAALTEIDSRATHRFFVANLIFRSWLTTNAQPRYSRLGA